MFSFRRNQIDNVALHLVCGELLPLSGSLALSANDCTVFTNNCESRRVLLYVYSDRNVCVQRSGEYEWPMFVGEQDFVKGDVTQVSRKPSTFRINRKICWQTIDAATQSVGICCESRMIHCCDQV